MKMTSVFLSGYWDGVKEALPGALGNTVIGILVVFFALILISFVISMLKFVSVIERKQTSKTTEKNTAESTAAPSIPAQAIENTFAQIEKAEELSEELLNDLVLVAVITAAIRAYEEANGNVAAVANGLVVRSIRRAKESGWKNA
ncbi:MAG: OadG family protein [Lachnospiraceae bacterium]|nr:OadG family protein [Lachnospiraceae bacterium]